MTQCKVTKHGATVKHAVMYGHSTHIACIVFFSIIVYAEAKDTQLAKG